MEQITFMATVRKQKNVPDTTWVIHNLCSFKLYRFCALYYWSKILFQLFFFSSFVDYCRKNKATVDVERKEKVEDIADTLKRLKLFSAAASGEQ